MAVALMGFTSMAPPASAQDLAFIGARVFDGEQVLDGVTVLVRDGRITAVGADVTPPDGLERVDAAGHTLLPGFIDAHGHVFSESQLRTALAFGVTTVLDQFGDPPFLRRMAAEQDSGFVTARADLFGAGIIATAPGGHGTQFSMDIPTLSSLEQAPAFVADRVAEGSDWIKIIRTDPRLPFPTLDLDIIGGLIRAAHEHGRIAVVHVATVDDALAVAKLGADGIVHTAEDRMPGEDFGARFAATGAFVVPTLTVLRGAATGEEGQVQMNDPLLGPLLDAEQRSTLEQSFRRRPGAESGWAHAAATVRSFHDAGVPILGGSDAPNPNTAHGVSIHRELQNLVEAGLSPLEALRSATSAPAAAFDLTDRGRIAPGQVADLVLVEGDPTADVADTRGIIGVWKRGVRWEGR